MAIVGNSLSLAVLVYLALNPVTSIAQTTIIFVLIGVTGAAYGLLMAHGRAFLPAHLTGRGVTLLNFFSIGGVGVMQFATGPIVSANAVTGQPESGYAALFAFYAAMLAISLFIYLFVRDAKPERAKLATA